MIRLLVVAIALVGAAQLAEAQKKPAADPTSRFMCENLNICAKKVQRTKKARKKRTTAKASSKKAVSKSVAAKPAAPAPVKPEPKPLAAAPAKSEPDSLAAAPAKPAPEPLAAAPVKPVPKPLPAQAKPAAPQQEVAVIVPPKPVTGPGAEPRDKPRDDKPLADDGAACRADLVRLGADISIPVEIVAEKGCAVANPVTLKSLRTAVGTISLPGHPILNCAFARQFTTWLGDVAAPVVAAHGDARLAAISTGPGYQCRGRNGDASAKMSEHAFGNAIDIDGLTVAGKKRIDIASVADPASPEHRPLMALRVSACGYFTTVLGPGSNAAHAAHYHFDLGRHGKSGNYRICE